MGLDRFDYLFSRFKERGIYLHIDTLVARAFLPGDGLDYEGGFPSLAKCYPTMNERLIELQQEFMREFLCHTNPYTGLRLIDDPAVMTVQISNEESFLKDTSDTDKDPAVEPYRKERRARFNAFLRMKYFSRERLKEAWTFEGKCALKEEEDPFRDTVNIVYGSFHQPTNEPMGAWDGPASPARYADYMEFGILMNRRYYRRMKDFLLSIGVKVPIAASNLLGGAADVYGHIDGDVMENNSYFNHPVPPFQKGNYLCVGPTEYVSVNPLTMQRGVGAYATTLLSFCSLAAVSGKPFVVSEWNEYGLHPFHSTASVQTVAYACLNDWDGLILYNHHTGDGIDDQPADEIGDIFDAYNDPAVVCQWGFMATMFLKGCVSPAKNTFDIVYTQNDLTTLPNFHSMLSVMLPYVGKVRNVFLDGGQYHGSADVAFNAGFLNGGDLSCAKHGVYYAWSPYRDAFRKNVEGNRLVRAAAGSELVAEGVHLSERALVIDNIAQTSAGGDYRALADDFRKAFERWGLVESGRGFFGGKLVSDTGEIVFDPDHAKFSISAPCCAYFSGAPEERIELTDAISLKVRNDRISLSLLAEEGELSGAKCFRLTAIGRTGMDSAAFSKGPDFMGIPLTVVTLGGKLYAETLEGEIFVRAKEAELAVLDPVGNVLITLKGEPADGGVRFVLDGSAAGVQFLLMVA